MVMLWSLDLGRHDKLVMVLHVLCCVSVQSKINLFGPPYGTRTDAFSCAPCRESPVIEKQLDQRLLATIDVVFSEKRKKAQPGRILLVETLVQISPSLPGRQTARRPLPAKPCPIILDPAPHFTIPPLVPYRDVSVQKSMDPRLALKSKLAAVARVIHCSAAVEKLKVVVLPPPLEGCSGEKSRTSRVDRTRLLSSG